MFQGSVMPPHAILDVFSFPPSFPPFDSKHFPLLFSLLLASLLPSSPLSLPSFLLAYTCDPSSQEAEAGRA